MKRRRMTAEAVQRLEHELEAKIRSARTAYRIVEEAESAKDEQNTKGSVGIPLLTTSILGPDLAATIHLIATPNLIHLLGQEAVAEARGSGQRLLRPGNDTDVKNEDDVLLWTVDSAWQQPNVWLRQGKTPIETDVSSLNHWSQSLLSPESRPITADLVVVHPSRIDSHTDVDEEFISEYQSVFELCGYGTIPLKPSGNLSFTVDQASWDSTARAISAAVQNWARLTRLHSLQTHEEEAQTLIAILVVWPLEGWVYTRSALAAVAQYLPQPSSTGARVAVQLVPEDVVLSRRLRKSKLVGLATGLYSMLVTGSSILVADRTIGRPRSAPSPVPEGNEPIGNGSSHRSPAAGDNTPSTIAGDTPSTVAGSVNGDPHQSILPTVPFIHLAVTLSKDERWFVYSWCTQQGNSLSVRALRADSTGPEFLRTCLAEVATETKVSNFAVVFYETRDLALNETQNIGGVNYDYGSLFQSLLSYSEYRIRLLSFVGSTMAIACSPSLGRSESEVMREKRTMLSELDDLAFLSTAVERPSRGELSSVLLGALAPGVVHQRRFYLPLHLRCAVLMASFLDGLVPS